MDSFVDVFHQFWRRHPALLYGVTFAFGVSWALGAHWMFLLPMVFIFFPLLCKPPSALYSRLCLAACVFIVAYCYASSSISTPEAETSIEGKGIVTLSTLTKKNKFSREIWEYRCWVESFVTAENDTVVAKNIPCIITLSLKKGSVRPLADQKYLIEGTLIPARGYYARIIADKKKWTPISGTFSLAEYRYHAKQWVSQMIHSNVHDKRVYEFLRGIATGDFQDQELQFEFSRFGLQHIMAISGFHFAIVSGFFVFFIRLFAPRKVAALVLVFLMCSYFIFLGPSPSIMRAWMMVLVVIGGCLSERHSNGLNSLGIAVMTILIVDPAMIHHVGFQFSTLITGGILLCYPSFDYLLQQVFTKRPLYEVIDMSMRDQHGYCILTILRKVLSLSLTVNCISAPLAIYYFQKFPVMGLVYNWFFPFMVSISITLLITAFLTSWMPPLSACIHAINTKYTSTMLDFVYNMPISFDIYVRYQGITAPIMIVMLSFIFFTAIFIRVFVENSCQEKKDFAFI
jgi:competence protein ComEC